MWKCLLRGGRYLQRRFALVASVFFVSPRPENLTICGMSTIWVMNAIRDNCLLVGFKLHKLSRKTAETGTELVEAANVWNMREDISIGQK